MSDKLNRKEREFLDIVIRVIEERGYVTTKNMSDMTDIPVSTVRRYMKKMCELNILDLQGKNKNSQYYLKKS